MEKFKGKKINIIDWHHKLNDNQFYKAKYPKSRAILHHTAGGSAQSSVDWWNKKPDHVATPYIIGRDGSIYETFNPECWAYALGLNSSSAEKKSVQIEICNYGWCIKRGGKFYTGYGKEMPADKVVTYKEKHRGHYYYEKYTNEQIKSTVDLLEYIAWRFRFEITPEDVKQFWWYDRNSKSSLLSHTSLRRDKSDIHPQPELVKAIYDRFGYKGIITE